MTPVVTGWVVSAALLGSLGGAIAAGAAADRIGRRKVIMIAALIFAVGIVGAALSPNVPFLIASRLVLGVAVGVATSVIPVYISEIAPARHRGARSGLFQVMIMVGVLASSLVALVLTPYGAWRWMIGIGILPAVGMLVGARLLPESPRWLVEQGRYQEAACILERLGDPNSEREVQRIRAICCSRRGHVGLRAILASAESRRLLLVGSGLGVLQQLVGINAVTYYAPSLLKNIGFTDWSAIAANLGISALGLVATIVMAFQVVDRFGRRTPLMWGALGMAASMAMLGGVFASGGTGDVAAYAAVLALLMFQICFALSWGGIVWIVLGEMFPLHMRGTAMGIAVFATEITSVIVGSMFPVLLAQRPSVMFFGFALMGGVSFLWALTMVPETRARSLEEIEAQIFGLRLDQPA
jgi:sugar porter (SP) family MFS transporter